MRRALKGRRCGGLLAAFGAAVVPGVVWALAVTDTGPPYRVGRHETARGQAITLPEKCNVVTGAAYGPGGDLMLIHAYHSTPDWEQTWRGGSWLVDRKKGSARLLNDDRKGDLWNHRSLNLLQYTCLSPDGRRVAAVRKVYRDEARALTVKDSLDDMVAYRHLVVIDPTLGQETFLGNIAELERELGVDDPNTGSLHLYHGFMWLDDRRLMLRVNRWVSGQYMSALYSVDADTKDVAEVFRPPPDVGCFALLHRVSPGKLLVDFQEAAAYRRAAELSLRVSKLEEEMRVQEVRELDAERIRRWRAGRYLAVLDLRGRTPQMTVLRTINWESPIFHDRRGQLSADEKFYAFQVRESDKTDRFCLGVCHVPTGRYQLLERERCRLLAWHPDGTRLLAILEPEAPADLPARLVEIPVGDILEKLAAGGGQ